MTGLRISHLNKMCGWDGNDYISLRAARGNFSGHQPSTVSNLRFIPKWKALHKYKDHSSLKDAIYPDKNSSHVLPNSS